MEKLYYVDTYQKSTMCTVTEVRHTDKATEVLTDRTVFYPECGGQPGDCGKLGPYDVLDTRKAEDGDSILILDKACPVTEGEHLELSLNWDHRYKYMVMHTCQHLVSGTLFNLFGIGTVAVHLGDSYLTVETDQSSISSDTIDALVKHLNQRIQEAHPVIYHEMSHQDAEALGMRRSIKVEGDVRIVEIMDVDRIACGGVHAGNTSELRLVVFAGQEQIRGHVRLYFHCGQEAIDNSICNSKVVLELDSMLSCKPSEIVQNVTSMNAALTEAKSARNAALKTLAAYEVKDCLEDGGLCSFWAQQGSDLQNYAQAVTEYEDLAMCILCPDGNRTKWLIALKGRYECVSFNDVRANLLSKINAKGGGRPPVYQGVADCNDKEALFSFVDGFRKMVSSQKA